MNARAKHKLALAAWVACFFLLGFGVWSFQAGHLMIVVFLFLSIVLYTIYALAARCPECRFPVLLRPFKAGKIELYTWSLLAPNECRNCGRPL